MGRKNHNANFASHRAQAAKADRERLTALSNHYRSYEAKLDEMLDQAEADNEARRALAGR